MSQDTISHIIDVVSAQTTERLALFILLLCALAVILLLVYLWRRGRGEQKTQQAAQQSNALMLSLLGQMVKQNGDLQTSNDQADDRNARTLQAFNATLEKMTGVIDALGARTASLLQQGQRTDAVLVDAAQQRTTLTAQNGRMEATLTTINQLLTDGKTSAAQMLEAQMPPIEDRLGKVEATLVEQGVKLDEILRLLKTIWRTTRLPYGKVCRRTARPTPFDSPGEKPDATPD